MSAKVVALLLYAATSPAIAAEAPPRDADIIAPDGTMLKATYFAAAKPGPGVLLLHMCNSNRKAWEPLARQLGAAGIHALALDYRGFGESKGEWFENDFQKQQQVVNEKWPGDIDAALAFLRGQVGVDKSRIGAAGGSCGVNQAVLVASPAPRGQVARSAGRRHKPARPGIPAPEPVVADFCLGCGRRSVRQRCASLDGVAD